MAKTGLDGIDILIKMGTEESRKKAEAAASKKAGAPVSIPKSGPQPFPQMLANYTPQKSLQNQETKSKETMKRANPIGQDFRLQEITAAGAKRATADIAEKELEDYRNSSEYVKNRAESVRQQQRAIDQDETQNFSPTSDFTPPAPETDDTEYVLRLRAEAARQEANAAQDAAVTERNRRDTDELSEEEKEILEQYAINQIRDQNLPVEMMGMMPTARQEAAPLINRIGQQRTDELAETYMRDQNAQFAADVEEAARKEVNDSMTGYGFAASLKSIPVKALSGLPGAVGQLQGWVRNTGQYSTLDPNEAGTIGQAYSGAVQGQAVENILGKDPNLLNKGLALGYQGIMSFADNIARGFLGGGAVGGAMLAATGSFSQTMADASRAGATPAQAAILATATAGIEAISEKIPLDGLITQVRLGKQPWQTIVKNAFLQAGIEATTEEISLLGSLLMEAAVLQEKSGYEQTAMQEILRGKSPMEARAIAAQQVWDEVVNTALVSSLSGGMSSVGAGVAGNVRANMAEAGVNNRLAANAEQLRQEAIAEAQRLDEQAQPNPTLEQVAQTEQFRRENQQETAQVTQPQQAAQTAEQVQTISSKNDTDILRDLVQKAGEAKTGATNAMARAALENPTVLEQLVQQTGVKLSGTNAEKRKAVKDALNQLADKQKQDRFVSGIVNMIPGKSQNVPQTSQKPASGIQAGNYEFDASGTVGAAKSRFQHEVRESGVYRNTFKNANNENIRSIGEDAKRENPGIAQYDLITEEETLKEAQLRTGTAQDHYIEHRYLMKKDGWTGADNDVAMRLLNEYRKEGKGDRFRELAAKQRSIATQSGQLSQSFAKYSRGDAIVAVKDAVEVLEGMSMGDIPGKFWKKADKTRAAMVGDPDDYTEASARRMTATEQSNTIFSKRKMDRAAFDAWKTDITNSMLEIANDIEAVPEGDADSMRGIVRQLAQLRRTTAWFGTQDRLTKNADRILNKMDFDTAKTIAKAQLAMIPDDFRKRSPGEVAKTIRIHNMLSALTTTNRNTVGNATMGIMDAFSDSTTARAMDIAMSKFTGMRTVGNDLKYSKTYFNAARDAADMASLCVELNIPMESESMYSAGNTRTHSTQGGPVSRFLSAYEKYMKYSLEVTDKFFEGGSTAAVNQSIRDLGIKTGLSENQISGLAQRAGERRTFKENRSLAKGAKKIKEGANTMFGVGDVGAGDILMPFAVVPMNVGQSAVDYSGSGAVLGIKEMIDVIKAVKNGDKAVKNSRTGEAVPIEIAQRKAVSDFGRGVTGVGLVALSTAAAAAGAIELHNSEDWEEKAFEQSLNLDGAQINLSAIWRGLTGEKSNDDPMKWRNDDIIVGLDFLEPFNSSLHIGYALSQEDGIADMIQNYPKHALLGVVDALMDMPVMALLSDVQDLVRSIGETDEEGNPATMDALGNVAGNLATSVVPSFVRQTAQTIDPYYRDTYDPNPLKQAGKQVLASIPFASTTLPKKYNGLGEVQKRYDNATVGGKVLGALNNLFLPDDVEKVKGNEVTEYIRQLSESTGENSVYPEEQAPYSFKLRGQDIELTGDQRATYQKVYGETNMQLYSGLINYPGFSTLPEVVQIDALTDAKAIATKKAKVAVSDYLEAPTETPEELVKGIVMDSVNRLFTGAFSDIVEDWNLGYDTADDVADLDAAYMVYDKMPDIQKRAFRDGTSGRVKYFLEAKARGIDTQTFTDFYQEYQDIGNSEKLTITQKANEWAAVLEEGVDAGVITENQKAVMKRDMVFRYSLQAESSKFDEAIESGVKTDVAKMIVDLVLNAQGTGAVNKDTGKRTVRDVDKWETLAESQLTEEQKDIAIKLYMPDYDPNASSPDKTEIKYEYARQVYGLSPEEFVEAKRAYDDERYKADKIASIMEHGYDKQLATNLYYLFYGNQKKVPSVEWYNTNFS